MKADLFTDQHDKDNSSLQDKVRQVGLLPIIKDTGSINSGVPGCDTNPLLAQHPPAPLHIVPWDLEGKRDLMRT